MLLDKSKHDETSTCLETGSQCHWPGLTLRHGPGHQPWLCQSDTVTRTFRSMMFYL